MKAEYPKKLYYSIGEVSEIVELPQSVLRYWETEFKQLTPSRNKTGKRVYREADISRIFQIKELLYGKRYTIEGAKHALRQRCDKSSTGGSSAVEELKSELKKILKILDK